MTVDIDDSASLEEQIVNLCRAKELHDRIERIHNWVTKGIIHVDAPEAPVAGDIIVVRFGENMDRRERYEDFPSADLIAHIALAEHTGYAKRPEVVVENYHIDHAIGYGVIGNHGRTKTNYLRNKYSWDRFSEHLAEKVSKLTVAVTNEALRQEHDSVLINLGDMI
jgi:hypothetical protein